MIPDGRVGDSGEVLEIEPPSGSSSPGATSSCRSCKAEGYHALTYELEPMGDIGQAHRDPRDRQRRLEAHRGRVERLAARSWRA